MQIPCLQLHPPRPDPSIRLPVDLFRPSIHLHNPLPEKRSRTFSARQGGGNPQARLMKANPYLEQMNPPPRNPSSRVKSRTGSKRWRQQKRLNHLPRKKRNCPIGSTRSAQDRCLFLALPIRIKLIG